MPFFSIIIPVYNRESFILETLESIKNQTYKNWECLIIDDGSTDSTATVIKPWISDKRKFRYVYQENAERSVARNTGIELAQGEYICFLDSDDKFFPDNLMNWFCFLKTKQFPRALSFCDFEIRGLNGVEITPQEKMRIPNNEIINFLFQNPMIPARSCVHHSLLLENKFELDVIITEDVCLWMVLASKFSVFFSDHIGAAYFLHAGNSINLKTTSYIQMLSGLKRFFSRNPYIKSQIPKDQYKGYFSRIYTNIARHYLFHNKRFKALIYLIRAILCRPIHRQTKFRLMLIFKTLTSSNKKLNEQI